MRTRITKNKLIVYADSFKEYETLSSIENAIKHNSNVIFHNPSFVDEMGKEITNQIEKIKDDLIKEQQKLELGRLKLEKMRMEQRFEAYKKENCFYLKTPLFQDQIKQVIKALDNLSNQLNEL